MAASKPPPAQPVDGEPPGSDLDDELRPEGEGTPAPPPDGASTTGWDEDEPPASILDDPPPAAAPADLGPVLPDEADLGDAPPDWDDAPLSTPLDLDEGGWDLDSDDQPEGWDELPARAADATDDGALWADLEDEARLLPPGLERVGRVERVRLVGHGLAPLLARMDTGAAASRLHASVVQHSGARVTLELAGQRLDLSRADDGAGDPDRIWVRARLRLGGLDLDATLSVQPPTDGEPVVLGCDVLAGRFVVDPAARLLGAEPA